MNEEFGIFIKRKREEKGYSLRGYADATGIAPAYMSDIEKGERPAPSQEKLDMMALKLDLSETDKNTFFDLAGLSKGKNNVSPDLSSYIMDGNLEKVRVALRIARDTKADNSVWQEVINILEERRKNGG